MKCPYKDISDAISERLSSIRKGKNSEKEESYENLCRGIEQLIPPIENYSNDLKNVPLEKWMDAFSLVRNPEWLERCRQGFTYEKEIELLDKQIKSCYKANIRPALQEIELSKLKLKESQLDECKKMCKEAWFNALVKIRQELNIDDEAELLKAFSVIADWIEIQQNIDKIKLEKMLGGILEPESSQSTKVPENNVTHSNPKEKNDNNKLDEHDILLRSIFGKHLDNFLEEASKLGKGSDVARLVNWYADEYKLNRSESLNSPLKNALEAKGIITASKATWNNIIRNK